MKIGIDIGGSHVGIGLVDEFGNIQQKKEKYIVEKIENESQINKQNLKEEITQFIIQTIKEYQKMDFVENVGIAVPGTVNQTTIIKAVNLGIENYEITPIIEKETGTLEKYKKEVYAKLAYLSYAPIIFISAKTGQRVDKLFDMINDVAKQNAMRISTSVLNQVINEAIAVVQPPSDKGKRLKILYGTQVSTKPPTFVIFVNNKELFHFSYERYLVNQIRKEFGLVGTPIRIISREKSE